MPNNQLTIPVGARIDVHDLDGICANVVIEPAGTKAFRRGEITVCIDVEAGAELDRTGHAMAEALLAQGGPVVVVLDTLGTAKIFAASLRPAAAV